MLIPVYSLTEMDRS